MCYYSIYIPLRGFCGGWHAEKSWICTVVSFVTIILAVLAGKYQVMNYNEVLWGIALAIAVLFILWMAPVDSEAKRLSESEINHYKRNIRVIVFVEVIAFLFLLGMKMINYASCVGMVFIIQCISLLVTKMNK